MRLCSFTYTRALTLEYSRALTVESSWQALMLFHRLLRETPAREKLYDKTQTYLPCLLFFPLSCPSFPFFFCAGETTRRKLACLALTCRLLFLLSYCVRLCVCVGVGAGAGVDVGAVWVWVWVQICGFPSSWTTLPPKAFRLPLWYCVCRCLCLCLFLSAYIHMYVEVVDLY